MSSVWDERAEAYRTSEAHREGEDLDLLVEWAQGARTALDVATGEATWPGACARPGSRS